MNSILTAPMALLVLGAPLLAAEPEKPRSSPLPAELEQHGLAEKIAEISAQVENIGATSYTNLSMLALFEDYWSDEDVLKNLASEDYQLVVNSLGILAGRGNVEATPTAQKLLNTDFGWLAGAIYLGETGNRAAVPYLIKGLRKKLTPRLHRQVSEILSELTQQDLGIDYSAWQAWWQSQHPADGFDFNSHLDVPAPARWDPSTGKALPRKVVIPSSAEQALHWLKLLDERRYEDAWKHTAEEFRQTVTKEAWINVMQEHLHYDPVAGSRKIESALEASTITGKEPPGEYLTVHLSTETTDQGVWQDNVMFVKRAGAWKVVGHSRHER